MKPQTDPGSELLNIKEAAAILKVSEASLRRWTNSGRLVCQRIGIKKERRFRREDLMAFLDGNAMADGDTSQTGRPSEVLLEGVAIEYGNHICTLYENDLGRLKWSVPFLADGLRNGDGCFLIATEKVRAEILGHIGQAWDGLPNAIETGQLIQSSGLPDGEEMCRYIERNIFMSTRAGWRSFRLLGDMSWCLDLGMSHADLFAYERQFNHEVGHRHPLVSVCQYDTRDFTGPAVLNALKCHEDTFKFPLSRFLAS